MPYPDSEYPSILRGKDKRESQRLLAAAPELLAALKEAVSVCETFTPFGGIAAKWQDLIEKIEGGSQ